MLVFLPVIFFFSTSVVVHRWFNSGKRVSLLVSAVLTGTIITFLTEILSLFHSFSFYPLTLSWFAATIISISFALPALKLNVKEKFWDLKKLPLDEQVLLFLVVLVLVITAITAIISIPNSWDAMTYHLARVEHWIQDKTIAYYPTHILRQLYYCPWAEFALAHFRLLCPWESVVNLLQWFAMAGSLVGVSLITKQLGGTRRAQLVACLTAVTLPMGILQAVSTQTDYVETFWLICFIFFVQEIRCHIRPIYVFSAGLSLGLALLTKGYAYILMIPFLVLLIVSISGLSKRVKTIFIIILCVFVLNVGYYERNQSAFGSVTLAKEGLVTSSFDFKELVGNLLRNFEVEIDVPFQKVNQLLPIGFSKISSLLGIDFSSDPSGASVKSVYYQDFNRSESYSGNFFHVILFTVIILLCWFMPRPAQGLRLYTVLICCVGILFCLFIRFQHWVIRFHLPMFIMFCPVIGVFMNRSLSSRKTIALAVLFFLNALPFLFFNTLHPWFGSSNIWEHQYYISRPIKHNYVGVAEQIKNLGCHEIGIITGADSWEYPLWALLREQQGSGHFRIEHVLVRNKSADLAYPLGSFNPCAIVIIREQPLVLLYKQYKKIWGSQNPDYFMTAVYVPVNLEKRSQN